MDARKKNRRNKGKTPKERKKELKKERSKKQREKMFSDYENHFLCRFMWLMLAATYYYQNPGATQNHAFGRIRAWKYVRFGRLLVFGLFVSDGRVRVRVYGEGKYQRDRGGDVGCELELGDVRCVCYCYCSVVVVTVALALSLP